MGTLEFLSNYFVLQLLNLLGLGFFFYGLDDDFYDTAFEDDLRGLHINNNDMGRKRRKRNNKKTKFNKKRSNSNQTSSVNNNYRNVKVKTIDYIELDEEDEPVETIAEVEVEESEEGKLKIVRAATMDENGNISMTPDSNNFTGVVKKQERYYTIDGDSVGASPYGGKDYVVLDNASRADVSQFVDQEVIYRRSETNKIYIVGLASEGTK